MAIRVIHSCEVRLVQWWRTYAHGADVGLSLRTCRFIICAFVRIEFCCAPGPRSGRTFFLMRQAPERSSREERQASGPLHHSSSGGLLAGQTHDTAAAPAGAGPWHCQKWSHEAKNGHAGCQRDRLDGRTESDPSEQNDTMRSHGTFLQFDIDFTGFASRAAQPKIVPQG
jgi:hypothetical protein